MRTLRIVSFFLFCAGNVFAQQKQNTIVVKKFSKISEIKIDSTYSKLLVYDQLHTRMDSAIVSFEMMVEVPVDNIFYGAPGGPIYKIKTPLVYKSNGSYLSPDMKKAWSVHPKGQPIKFQNIYVKVGDQKQGRWRDFTIKKP